MFLENKYTLIYNKIIKKARAADLEKAANMQIHHIIPRSLGGDDSRENLVNLTYKQHRVCHRLLIKMVPERNVFSMKRAYKLFNKKYDVSGVPNPTIYRTSKTFAKMVRTRKRKGSYKRGKDNNFAKPEIIKMVKKRMIENNPMKNEQQKQRMRNDNNNPKTKPVVVNGLEFPSLNAAARHFNTTPHLFKKNFTYDCI